MCVYSMVADHYIDKWTERVKPTYIPPYHYVLTPAPVPNPLTQEEIDDFRKLLERAKKYDQDTGQPDCELDKKKKLLKELAKELGVDLEL